MINNSSWDLVDLRNSLILIVTLWKDQESWFSRRSAQAQGADCQKSQTSAECTERAECPGEALAARHSKAFSRSCRIQWAAKKEGWTNKRKLKKGCKHALDISRSRCRCLQSTSQLHSKPVHSVKICKVYVGSPVALKALPTDDPKVAAAFQETLQQLQLQNQ